MSPLLSPAQPPQTHYELDGRRYVRVTTVLNTINQPGLARWRAKVGNDEADRISREATEHGTRLHEILARFNRQEPLGEVGDLEPCVERYMAWVVEHVHAIRSAERLVLSHDHGYGGTPDAVAEMQDGDLALLDFKTSKWRQPTPTFALQLAAYRLALAENDVLCRRRIVLQFPSDAPGELLVHEYREHRADTMAWLDCLRLYRWLEGWKP
jgi:hypothetical protein